MIAQALKLLRGGDVVGIPTETVYGLAADITQPQAIEKIFKTKERPFFDPLIVHVCDLNQVSSFAELPPKAARLAKKFWPGPLTLILPKKPTLNPMITASLEKVGVRAPNHPLTLQLIKELGHPVAAPSANKFGRTSPTRAEHVRAELGPDVYVLDGGSATVGVESTVAEVNESTGEIYIYRPGAITAEMLAPFGAVQMKSSPVAPGQLQYHYQPQLPVVWLKTQENLSLNQYDEIRTRLKISVLYPVWVHLGDNAAIVARNLYFEMRTAGATPSANCIIIHCPYNLQADELWAAIYDRLTKAASLTF